MAVSRFWQNTATHAVAITKSDTVNIADAGGKTVSTRGIYVGGAGDVDVLMDKNQEVLFKAVPVGTILPIETSRVMSTNTTATLLIALY